IVLPPRPPHQRLRGKSISVQNKGAERHQLQQNMICGQHGIAEAGSLIGEPGESGQQKQGAYQDIELGPEKSAERGSVEQLSPLYRDNGPATEKTPQHKNSQE